MVLRMIKTINMLIACVLLNVQDKYVIDIQEEPPKRGNMV